MITDAEILELELLLHEQEKYELLNGLQNPKIGEQNPNYILLHQAINSQTWGFVDGKPSLLSGYAGVALEGSSRSGKTWSGVDIIIYLCKYKHAKEGCTINLYRETYNEFKTTLYDDFKRRLDDFDLPNPFHNAREVPSFRIGKSTIHFLGDGKHGGGCDYAFFNEAMMLRKEVFDQVEMRCRKFWWMDYNPSYTVHWVFDSVVTRDDVAFMRSTFKDNPHISPNELNKILSYEPWQTGSYEVREDGAYYNGNLISDNNQPPPHFENVRQGTADVFMWKVYGLGLRGAMQGVIFNSIIWDIEPPYSLSPICTIDFGFTNDPCAITRYYESKEDIYIEPICYHPIDTPEGIDLMLKANGIPKTMPLICDSADKYTHENKGAVEMVKGLQKLGWKASKVKKDKSVMFWLTSMKKKKIHIIKNQLYKFAKKEVENYKWKEINGILINQPEDAFNHIFDSSRYGHMAHNQQVIKTNASNWAGAFG